ncbi:MAG: hypothetical protein RLZZ324_804, partial [Candidatus Parcubacteria bacterium]
MASRIGLWFIAALSLCYALPCAAQTRYPQNEGYVTDKAGLLPPATRSDL